MADNNGKPNGQSSQETEEKGERHKESQASSGSSTQSTVNNSSGSAESKGGSPPGVQVAGSIPQKVYMSVVDGINHYTDEHGNPVIPVYDTGSASNTPLYFQSIAPESNFKSEPPAKKRVLEKENTGTIKMNAQVNLQPNAQASNSQAFADAHRVRAEENERRSHGNSARVQSANVSAQRSVRIPDNYFQDIWSDERGKFFAFISFTSSFFSMDNFNLQSNIFYRKFGK